ncbi:MAG: hypothetical protein ACOZQL_16925 [Myxococcota bacterium]
MSRRELTWFERAFIKSSRAFADFDLGYHIDFDEELIRQHGIAGFMKWGRKLWALETKLTAFFGEENMHFVAAFSSFFNGCDYCTWGHLFAVNLVHLEKTGRLYPIDERESLVLMQQGDTAVVAELERRLAEHPEHVRLLKRMLELRDGAPAQGDEDHHLGLARGLFEWINECSITVEAPAPPLGSIAKKKDLIARYQAARAPLRAQRAG